MLLAGLAGGTLITAVGVYDWVDLESKNTSNQVIKANVSAGIGLIFTIIAGGVLAIASGVQLYPKYERWARRREGRGPEEPSAPVSEPPPPLARESPATEEEPASTQQEHLPPS
jgi:hypothetical protein